MKPPLAQGHANDFQTPPEALIPLLPYLKKEKQKLIKAILPHPRKLLGSEEKNDIWREGYNKCLWDIKQRINGLDLFNIEK